MCLYYNQFKTLDFTAPISPREGGKVRGLTNPKVTFRTLLKTNLGDP